MQNQRHTPIVSAILSDLRRGWRFFVPLFLVCVLIMYALLSALTDAAGRAYQKKQLSEHLGLDTAQLLHLEYWKNDETPEFADVLARFHAHLSELEGVLRIGQYDATGAYFEELRAVEAYQTRNAAFVKGSRYETVPGIARILRIDESLLPLFEIGISEYPRLESGHLPLYASDAFQTLLPLGTQLICLFSVALTMATRIVCMDVGVIKQVGTPEELYFHPKNLFVAGFIGDPPMNFIKGSVLNGVFTSDDGFYRFPLSRFDSQQLSKVEGKKITLGYRPENAVIDLEDEDKEQYLKMKGTVEVYEMLGDIQNVYLNVGNEKAIIKAKPEIKIEIGRELDYFIKKDQFHFFDSVTEDAIEL